MARQSATCSLASRTLSYAINRDGCEHAPINETVKAVQRAFFSWASPSCTDLYFLYDGLVEDERTNISLGPHDRPDHDNLIVWRRSWPPPGVTDLSTHPGYAGGDHGDLRCRER